MNNKPIRILHDLVLVLPDRERDTKRGSIYIPEVYQPIHSNDERSLVRKSDMYAIGEVLQVGPGERKRTNGGTLKQGRVPVGVEVGDRVLYRRAEASPVPFEGDDRVIVREVSIAGRVEEQA